MIDKILLLLGLQRIKNKKCEHEYYCSSQLDKYHTSKYQQISLYCPKCNKQKHTSYSNWLIIKKEQEIKREYLKNIWKLDGTDIDKAFENLNKNQKGNFNENTQKNA